MQHHYTDVCAEKYDVACVKEILNVFELLDAPLAQRADGLANESTSVHVTLDLSPVTTPYEICERAPLDGDHLSSRLLAYLRRHQDGDPNSQLQLDKTDVACFLEALQRCNADVALACHRRLSKIIICGADEATLDAAAIATLVQEWRRHVLTYRARSRGDVDGDDGGDKQQHEAAAAVTLSSGLGESSPKEAFDMIALRGCREAHAELLLKSLVEVMLAPPSAVIGFDFFRRSPSPFATTELLPISVLSGDLHPTAAQESANMLPPLAVDLSCQALARQRSSRVQVLKHIHALCAGGTQPLCHPLRHLSLAYTELNFVDALGSDTMQYLVDLFKSLESLSLRGNPSCFGSTGSTAVAQWIRNIVQYCDAAMAPDGAPMLLTKSATTGAVTAAPPSGKRSLPQQDVIPPSAPIGGTLLLTLRRLDVSRMGLKDDAAAPLAELLRCSPIEVFAARRNHFTHVGFASFAEALILPSCRVAELFLGMQVPAGGAAYTTNSVLARAMQSPSSLFAIHGANPSLYSGVSRLPPTNPAMSGGDPAVVADLAGAAATILFALGGNTSIHVCDLTGLPLDDVLVDEANALPFITLNALTDVMLHTKTLCILYLTYPHAIQTPMRKELRRSAALSQPHPAKQPPTPAKTLFLTKPHAAGGGPLDAFQQPPMRFSSASIASPPSGAAVRHAPQQSSLLNHSGSFTLSSNVAFEEYLVSVNTQREMRSVYTLEVVDGFDDDTVLQGLERLAARPLDVSRQMQPKARVQQPPAPLQLSSNPSALAAIDHRHAAPPTQSVASTSPPAASPSVPMQSVSPAVNSANVSRNTSPMRFNPTLAAAPQQRSRLESEPIIPVRAPVRVAAGSTAPSQARRTASPHAPPRRSSSTRAATPQTRRDVRVPRSASNARPASAGRPLHVNPNAETAASLAAAAHWQALSRQLDASQQRQVQHLDALTAVFTEAVALSGDCFAVACSALMTFTVRHVIGQCEMKHVMERERERQLRDDIQRLLADRDNAMDEQAHELLTARQALKEARHDAQMLKVERDAVVNRMSRLRAEHASELALQRMQVLRCSTTSPTQLEPASSAPTPVAQRRLSPDRGVEAASISPGSVPRHRSLSPKSAQLRHISSCSFAEVAVAYPLFGAAMRALSTSERQHIEAMWSRGVESTASQRHQGALDPSRLALVSFVAQCQENLLFHSTSGTQPSQTPQRQPDQNRNDNAAAEKKLPTAAPSERSVSPTSSSRTASQCLTPVSVPPQRVFAPQRETSPPLSQPPAVPLLRHSPTTHIVGRPIVAGTRSSSSPQRSSESSMPPLPPPTQTPPGPPATPPQARSSSSPRLVIQSEQVLQGASSSPPVKRRVVGFSAVSAPPPRIDAFQLRRKSEIVRRCDAELRLAQEKHSAAAGSKSAPPANVLRTSSPTAVRPQSLSSQPSPSVAPLAMSSTPSSAAVTPSKGLRKRSPSGSRHGPQVVKQAPRGGTTPDKKASSSSVFPEDASESALQGFHSSSNPGVNYFFSDECPTESVQFEEEDRMSVNSFDFEEDDDYAVGERASSAAASSFIYDEGSQHTASSAAISRPHHARRERSSGDTGREASIKFHMDSDDAGSNDPLPSSNPLNKRDTMMPSVAAMQRHPSAASDHLTFETNDDAASVASSVDFDVESDIGGVAQSSGKRSNRSDATPAADERPQQPVMPTSPFVCGTILSSPVAKRVVERARVHILLGDADEIQQQKDWVSRHVMPLSVAELRNAYPKVATMFSTMTMEEYGAFIASWSVRYQPGHSEQLDELSELMLNCALNGMFSAAGKR